jgi:hypothetical protein
MHGRQSFPRGLGFITYNQYRKSEFNDFNTRVNNYHPESGYCCDHRREEWLVELSRFSYSWKDDARRAIVDIRGWESWPSGIHRLTWGHTNYFERIDYSPRHSSNISHRPSRNIARWECFVASSGSVIGKWQGWSRDDNHSMWSYRDFTQSTDHNPHWWEIHSSNLSHRAYCRKFRIVFADLSLRRIGNFHDYSDRQSCNPGNWLAVSNCHSVRRQG